MSSCPSCHASVGPKVRFCPACGSSLPSTPAAPETQPWEETERSRASVTDAVADAQDSPAPPPPTPVSIDPEPVLEGSQTESPAPPPKPEPATPPASPTPTPTPAKSAWDESLDDADTLAVAIRFPYTMVAGHRSIAFIRVKNNSPETIDRGEVTLEARSLAELCLVNFRRLPPGETREVMAEIEPTHAGPTKIELGIIADSSTGRQAYRGSCLEVVLKEPDNQFNISIGDIQSNSGSAANQGLGADYKGDVNISNLLGDKTPQTLNELLSTERTNDFERIDLDIDYSLSAVAIDVERMARQRSLRLPSAFVGHAQPCRRAELARAEEPDSPALTLVAREEFTLGRNRKKADLTTWWWPRSESHDELTRRISQIHVCLRRDREGLMLLDPGSANGTTCDGQALATGEQAEPARFDRRTSLSLAHEYGMDIEHIDGAYPQGPQISGIERWTGPAATSAPPQSGSVNFTPTSCDPLPTTTVWVFTDAAFGSSAANAISLADSELAEVQGRFHWHRGCFWVESIANNSAIGVNEQIIRAGEIVPLTEGAQLRLGTQSYRFSGRD